MARTTESTIITKYVELGHAPSKWVAGPDGLWLMQGYNNVIFMGPMSGIYDVRDQMTDMAEEWIARAPLEREV